MSEANKLLEVAFDEVEKLSSGELFLVKDLFKGYEWNRIDKRQRLLLGILFLNSIKSDARKVKILEKTSSGQQKYMKV